MAVDSAVQWLGDALPLLGALFLAGLAIVTYFRSRKAIVFEAWVNMTGTDESNVGRRVADLLLFKLRFVKRIHEQSGRKLETWQPSRDMPAFRQTLDEDIRLMGSVELGKYGSVVSTIVMFVLRLVPMMFRPARLRGSIHVYGKEFRLLATLEQAGGGKNQGGIVQLWEVIRTQEDGQLLAETVEELAYRIYLDLASEDLFKSWEAFRAYTVGMSHYVAWIDLEREADWLEAEKHYRAALVLEPRNPTIKYNLALLKYFRLEAPDNEEAILLFQSSLNAPSRQLSARAHSGLASALASKFARFNVAEPRLLQEGMMHGRTAITLAPEIDGAHKAYAYACHQWSEYLVRTGTGSEREIARHRELAVEHYREAFRMNPQHYIAHNNLGNLFLEWAKAIGGQSHQHERTEKFRLARTEFESALGINPSYHLPYDNLGNTFYEEGKRSAKAEERKALFGEAAKAFRNALQYEPNYPEGTNDLAMLHLEPDNDPCSPEEAFSLHLQSLRFATKSATQRQKLCKHFKARLESSGAQSKIGFEPPALIVKELAPLGCSCASSIPVAASVLSPA